MGTQDGTHGSLRHRQAHSLSFEFLSGICKENHSSYHAYCRVASSYSDTSVHSVENAGTGLSWGDASFLGFLREAWLMSLKHVLQGGDFCQHGLAHLLIDKEIAVALVGGVQGKP